MLEAGAVFCGTAEKGTDMDRQTALEKTVAHLPALEDAVEDGMAFERALSRFRKEFYSSGLMDTHYHCTITRLGRGRAACELAEDPSSCDMRLTLALMTHYIRAERFVWGYWDCLRTRQDFVRLFRHLGELVEGDRPSS